MAVDSGSVAKHGHYGLRLSAYTHVTSPLRRVADLINQRIIFAHLDHSPAPYTPVQLAALGGDMNRRTRAAREAKKNHFKHADQRIVAEQASTADLTALDSRRFHKVLKAEAAGPLRAQLAAELARPRRCRPADRPGCRSPDRCRRLLLASHPTPHSGHSR
nr:hypothetical protein GCM10017611_06930 [Rhodococcus wratislaviensis]